MKPRDIEHRESGIAAQLVRILGIDIGAAFDEQFDHVQRKQIGCGGVHQRRAAQRIDRVDVRAVIEHLADGVHIAEDRDVRQCDGVILLAETLGDQQRGAFRAPDGVSHFERHLPGVLYLRAVAEKQLHAGGIAGVGGFNQRRRFGGGMRVGIGIRAVIQKELDGGGIAGTARRDHQRRSHVAGARVDVGAVGDQETRFLQIGGRPHQGRGVGVIPFVDVGALFQQPLQRGRAGIEHRVHERCGTLRSAGVEKFGIFGGGLHEPLEIACMQRIDHGHSLRIQGREFGFVGERVGPIGALVDPLLDGGDLFRRGADRWAAFACRMRFPRCGETESCCRCCRAPRRGG